MKDKINEFDSFLLDNSSSTYIFSESYDSTMLYKEKISDRFYVIYAKDYTDGLSQCNYMIGAYLDSKEKVLYNANYRICKFITENSIYSRGELSDLRDELLEKIRIYINKFSFDNAEELKNNTFRLYNITDNRRYKDYKSDVRKLYIKMTNPVIILDNSFIINKINFYSDYSDYKILLEYLDDKEATVEKYSKLLIKENMEELGLDLNLYDDKVKYLKSIQLNQNNSFEDLHINKKIYNAIKYIGAKSLNITISYNNEDLTFRFDYYNLKNALEKAEKHTRSYNDSYNIVEEFLKDNSKSNNRNYEFEFSHIKSISYGKKELYRNDDIGKSIKKDMEIER